MAAKPDSQGQDIPVFRLAGILRERKRLAKSYQALAREIDVANGVTGRSVIDRRKLARIAAGDTDITLSLKEIVALDRYLEPFNLSLAKIPILEKPRVIETLMENEQVAFLLGARPQENRVDLSNWDVEGLAEILRDTGGIRRVKFDIQAVLLENTKKAASASGRSARSPWKSLLGPQGPSLVCLGSPRACHAAEVMLAKMFDEEPYFSAYGRGRKLPFHFVWARDLNDPKPRLPCRLGYSPDEFVSLAHPAADRVWSGKSHVLLTEDEPYIADVKGTKGFGVVVAQRRPEGQVWIVCAGLSGAATLAAARCVKDIHTNLPPVGKADQHSRIVWVVVEATTEREKGRSNPKIRRVRNEEILGGLRHFGD